MKKLTKIPSYIMNNNKALMIFSLVLAFVIWFAFTMTYNPVSTTTIKNVPINFDTSNTAVDSLGLSVVDADIDSVSVTISGQTVVISSITAADIVVTPSLSSVTEAGTYEVKLIATPSKLLTDFEIVSVSPKKVKVSFDEVITKTFDVVAEAEGCTASDGLVAELPVMTEAATKVINVSGAKKDVERIESVVARAKVNKELSETASFDADIILLDKKGKEIDSSNMTLGFREANITVAVSMIKTLPVEVVFGSKPSGLDFNYTLSDSDITVIGKPDIVESMTKVTLEPIECGLITANNNVFEKAVSLPAGVRVYDNNQSVVTVTVKSDSFSTKTLKVSNVTFVGLKSGLKTKVQSVQSIIVMGAKRDISKITAKDITLTVDVSGLDAVSGKQLPATVKLADTFTQSWVVTLDKDYLVTFTLS